MPRTIVDPSRSRFFSFSFLCALCVFCGESVFANPPTASYIFPAGGRRGTTVQVRIGGLYLYQSCAFELLGPGVEASKQLRSMPTLWFEGPLLPMPASQQVEDYPRDMAGTIRIDAEASLGARRGRLWTAEGAAGGLRFVVGELPEIVEREIDGDPIPVEVATPVTINGRIFPREDVDDWTFPARKGQHFVAEVVAARIGSPLDSRLELFDPHGRKIAENDDVLGADSCLRFTALEEGKYRLRIADANQHGGPAYVYRLTVAVEAQRETNSTASAKRPASARDFQLHLTNDAATLSRGGQTRLRIVAERKGGFNGPIVVRVAGLPDGVSASNATIDSGQTTTEITLTPTAFARFGMSYLSVHGIASLDGRLVRRTATLPAEPGETVVENVLLVVGRKAPFKIVGDYDLRLAPRGSVFHRRYRIERNGYNGPLQVRLADHQTRHLQGVTGPTRTIPADADSFDYPVRLPPWMEIGRTSRACVLAIGVLRDGDDEYTVGYSSEAQNEQIIAVIESGRLGVEIDRPSVAVIPGGKAEVTVHIRRGKGLLGPVQLDLIRPLHLRGLHAEPVVAAATQERAVFSLRFAEGDLGPFNMPLVLRATVADGSGAAIAETKLELVPVK